MLRYPITYENLNGEMVTEEHCFHLSKATLIEMEFGREGGFTDRIERIYKSEDNNAIYEEFKRIVLSAYGKKSDDGSRFIRDSEDRKRFEESEAFSEMILDLMQNVDKAKAFIQGIIPKNMLDQMGMSEPTKTSQPSKTGSRVLTRADVLAMDSGELIAGLTSGRFVLSSE